VVSGTDTSVGGLVGYTRGGSVTYCWSRATVTGSSFSVGGLVGENWGTIKGCYSIGSVGGSGTWVGGLVGGNYGPINQCYSTGAVNGRQDIGGLVGIGGAGSNVVQSFWDIQSSGRATSAAGMGKTTAEMRNAATFINAGWDFVGETVNGTGDFWRMPTATGYPLLSWQGAGVTTAASVEDFETGDFGRLPWQHAGDAFWTITSTESYGGTYSVRAGVIGEDQTSTLSLTLACGAGEIRFHVRVSSEPIGDKLVFRIDGLYMGEWSGKQDWTEVAFPVASGTRTFEWQYVKDGASSYYEDTAWLDSIVFPAGGAAASPPTSETGPIEVTAADFDTVVLGSNVPVLVNFYATWCPYCVAMLPIVEQVARDYAGRVKVCRIDVDYAPVICARYDVTAVPTFITFRNGQPQEKMAGTRTRQELSAAIDGLLALGAQPGPVFTLADEPIAHWRLDETSGNIAWDSAGAHHGWLFGNPTWLPFGGRVGGALRFDGIDDYVDTYDSQDLTVWTVSTWVKSPAAPSGRAPSGPVHRERNYQINWDHDNGQFRGAAALAVTGYWHSASFGALAANTWYHLAAGYDGNTLRAYKNGVLVGQNPAPSGIPDMEPASLKLGCHAVWPGQHFAGTVDDVRIYDVALSSDDVLSLFNAPR
ncbi:MAG: hypothetical protein JW741_07980, partial [Sedimentisphaerales bacterium]|nr:hypothetical protein [Sedimentisphaerales bacterium]